MRDQLARLAKPFPESFIEKPPKGKFGTYVNQAVINQALLAIVGPFDFEVREVLYGGPFAAVLDKETGEIRKPILERAVCGVICRLTLTIDGERHFVDEVGDCENPQNWETDGARIKDCLSDGLKRAAMRFGLGLHLWVKKPEQYILWASLTRHQEDPGGDRAGTPPAGPSPSGQSDPAPLAVMAKVGTLAREAGLMGEAAITAKAVEWGALAKGEELSVLAATERLPSLAKLTAHLKQLIADNKAAAKKTG